MSDFSFTRRRSTILRETAEVKYAFIHEDSADHKATRFIDVIDVSVSGFYAWRDRPKSDRKGVNRASLTRIEVFHGISRSTYGSP